ncbi:MAG TPA: hypothetical protein VGQ99_21095 [Tepidisphaeraceae bacterium]|jgi:hypothetical protein|nr:hypothetical protein [Tepidisphaeraceae bacterium]
MTFQTVQLAGKKFVILAEDDFRKLQSRAEEISAQDKGDIAEAKRRKAAGPAKPYSELRKKLGLA